MYVGFAALLIPNIEMKNKFRSKYVGQTKVGSRVRSQQRR